jgi:beta-glucanase (GH16 family)
MKKLSFIMAVGALLFCSCKKNEHTGAVADAYHPGAGWSLLWSDEFEGSTVNTGSWNYEIGTGANGWGNSELQYYRSQNARVENGRLIITAQREKVGASSFTSARITTKNKFSFNHGKIVGRIKVPEGYGIWPAFWMLGDSPDVWPACGEIDILEVKGGHGPNGDKRVYSTCHWQNASNQHEYYGQSYVHTQNLSKHYHYYEVEWDEKSVISRFNGVKYNEVFLSAPEMSELRNNNFFVILNVAVGGTFFSPAIYNPDLVTASFPQTMEVDWVRVYKKQ